MLMLMLMLMLTLKLAISHAMMIMISKMRHARPSSVERVRVVQVCRVGTSCRMLKRMVFVVTHVLVWLMSWAKHVAGWG